MILDFWRSLKYYEHVNERTELVHCGPAHAQYGYNFDRFCWVIDTWLA